MTSRALFCKGMLEDLRHKVWMFALSALASFMALPVLFLLMSREWNERIGYWYPGANWTIADYKLEELTAFFSQYVTITCGVVLVVGALIVGIFGFRHVFSKRMVDLYHSIPITRKQLFAIQYLNGFLIWFMPMLTGFFICAVMALVFLGNFAAWVNVLGTMLVTIANLVLAFLLIYHVALVAVMISGNILNTLVSGCIISFSVLALYGMYQGFSTIYFSTYYSFWENEIQNIFWTAPPVGAVYQLLMRANDAMQIFPTVMNLVVMVGLLAVAFWAYIRRPSELAEQGIKLKMMRVIFKAVVTLLAGMAGWMLFGFITDVDSFGWTIFGAILAGVLTYGVLDIIFYMDFKAFFKHKIQMAANMAVCVLVGFMFSLDLFGYDSYLPQKDNIAEMGIYINGYELNGNIQYFDEQYTLKNRLNNMKLTDAELIYAFLERMVENQFYKNDDYNYASENHVNARSSYWSGHTTDAYVRVKKKNGKTYYRRYVVREADEDVAVPILRDTSYIEHNIQIPVAAEIINGIDFNDFAGEMKLYTWNTFEGFQDKEFAVKLAEAYNADIMENPDLFIYSEEERFGIFTVRQYGAKYVNFRVNLYESMERVIAVLKEYGYDNLLPKNGVEDIVRAELEVYLYNTNNLKTFFGLEDGNEQSKRENTYAIETYEYENAVEMYEKYEYADAKEVTTVDTERVYVYRAVLEDKADVAELVNAVSLYYDGGYGRVFGRDYVYDCTITLFLENGDSYDVAIKEGRFPERLLDCFEKIEQ